MTRKMRSKLQKSKKNIEFMKWQENAIRYANRPVNPLYYTNLTFGPNWSFKKEYKRIFSETDPYGEETWEN
jgi:hypothetical protein